MTDAPTPASEMKKFVTFATHDGEVVPPPEKKAAPKAEEKLTEAKQEASAEAADDAAENETPEAKKAVAEPDDEAADEADEVAEPEEKPQPKKHSTPPNKRIAHYRRMAGDAERRAQDLERRLQALEQKNSSAAPQQGLTPEKQPATDADKDRPSPDKYKYGELDAEYIADLVTYNTKKALAADRAAQESERQRKAAEQQAQEFTQSVGKTIAAGKDKYDDFVDLVVVGGRNGEYQLSDDLLNMAVESEVGADILYHLASNPEEAAEISGKPLKEQARYFGRLEAKYSSPSSSDATAKTQQQDASEDSDESDDEPAPTKVKTSKAPPPPKNRARGGGGKTGFRPDTSDFREFEAGMEAAQR